MRKILSIILIFTTLIMVSGCATKDVIEPTATPEPTKKITSTPTPEPTLTPTPEPTPTAKPPQIEYKQVVIEDGLITIDIPSTLEVVKDYTGSLLFAYGMVPDGKGNDVYCNISITSFYQKEEPNLTYAMLDQIMDRSLVFPQGQDIVITRIGDVSISDTLNGYQAKCELYDNSVFNYQNLQGNGRYYKINIYTIKDFLKEEDLNKIFNSFKIDTDIEKESVDNFEVNIAGKTYYSSKLEGASMDIPENWVPTESNTITYNNFVMGMTANDNMGFINVTVYDKKLNNIDKFFDFYSMMVAEVANRGHVAFDDISNIEQYYDNAGRTLFVYPNNNGFIVHYLLEYENEFYRLEGYYFGKDTTEIDAILASLSTFKAPGKEIYQE